MTVMPDIPADQPLVHKDEGVAQVTDRIIGALDEYYFVSLSTVNPISHECFLTLWRIPSTSVGAIAVAQKTYINVYYAAGAANDQGDVVVVYRGVSGNWKMDKVAHQGSSMSVSTVTLTSSSSISTPSVWVTMDGLEVVLVDNTGPVHKRVWGFTLASGAWSWDVLPPTNEYPFTGTWKGFPRAARGLFSNETTASWMTYNSTTATYTSGAYPNCFTHTNSWGYYWQWKGIGDVTVDNPAWNWYVNKPFEQGVVAGQEWRGTGGTYGLVTAYGTVRSNASFSGSITVPDFANGETWVNGTWDTSFVPASVILRVYFTFAAPTRWIRTSNTVLPGTATYEANEVANGPNFGQVIINGVDYSSIATVVSIGSRSRPDDPEFEVDVVLDLTASPPAPGTLSLSTFIESLYPTEAALSAVGRSYADFPGGSTASHYNYSGFADPPYFYYLSTPTRGGDYSYDEWDFGQIGWLGCSASLQYTFDTSGLGGGNYELRDMTANWLDPREGTTPPLSTISANDLGLRGSGDWQVGQRFYYDALDVVGGDYVTAPTAMTYRYSLLDTTGDTLVLGTEHSLDAIEAWGIAAKDITTGHVSSWKGQVSVVPSITAPQGGPA